MPHPQLQAIFFTPLPKAAFSPVCTILFVQVIALLSALAEGLQFLIVNHHPLERNHAQREGSIVQKQGGVDVELNAGGKAHGGIHAAIAHLQLLQL